MCKLQAAQLFCLCVNYAPISTSQYVFILEILNNKEQTFNMTSDSSGSCESLVTKVTKAKAQLSATVQSLCQVLQTDWDSQKAMQQIRVCSAACLDRHAAVSGFRAS